MKDRLEGEKFIEHFSLIQALALEGSTGTWEKVEEDTAEVRVKLSGKLVGLLRDPDDRALHQGGGGPARLPHRRLDRQRAHDAPVHRRQLLRLLAEDAPAGRLHPRRTAEEVQGAQVRRPGPARAHRREGPAAVPAHHQAQDGHDPRAGRPTRSTRPPSAAWTCARTTR